MTIHFLNELTNLTDLFCWLWKCFHSFRLAKCNNNCKLITYTIIENFCSCQPERPKYY